METIRNYLESMFGNLPNTPEVQRARDELLQMMEDKYNELLSEGRTDNEAIGIVISEFGNLDELADTLGIEHVVRNQKPFQGTMLSREQIREYVAAEERSGLLKSIGVMLCIISPITLILANSVGGSLNIGPRIPIAIGLAAFFALIAAAVGIFVYNGVRMGKWRFIQERLCGIDYAAADELERRLEASRMTCAMMKTIGILLCVVCFVPVAVLGVLDVRSFAALMIGTAVLFLMVGVGVMLIINASAKKGAYMTLLRLNASETMGGSYVPSQEEEIYTNEKVAAIMEVYYPTVLCIYLCWSFITFHWHITWIIWPVAAILKHCISAVWRKKPGQERI